MAGGEQSDGEQQTANEQTSGEDESVADYQRDWHPIAGQDLGHWTWPPSRERVSNRLHPGEIQATYEQVLNGRTPSTDTDEGWGEWGSRVGGNVLDRLDPVDLDDLYVERLGVIGGDVPTEEVARHLTEKTLARADVRRDRMAVNRMAVAVVGELSTLKRHHGSFGASVSQTRFMRFLHQGEMDIVLSDYTYGTS